MEALQRGRFFVAMSRTLRSQMPGLAFHITARTQSKLPYFKNRLESVVERIIIEGITSSDATLLAYIVMPNHFHIVLRQGSRTLGWVMHPIMRRISLAVQRTHDIEGHVFERRYFSVACEDADYLRNAIIYTNLNAKRAKLCDDPSAYRWSSHVRFCESPPDSDSWYFRDALKLFGNDRCRTEDDVVAAYKNFVDWRIERDACDVDTQTPPPAPPTELGDRHFADRFIALPRHWRRPNKDLRDKAKELLFEVDSACEISCLRRRTLPRALTTVRRQVIAGLLQGGYQGSCIANFFRVSDSLVSAIATGLRYARPES